MPTLALALALGACASARMPVTNVPAGTYVRVEPASDVYHAVAINETTHAARVGNDVFRGTHWVDSQGRLHLMDDAGPCMGVESIWTYGYTGNRLTMTLVEDRCTARPMAFPQRMVYERR